MKTRLFGLIATAALMALPVAAQAPGAPPAPPASPRPAPAPPAVGNELGRIPVVMYHAIGAKGKYDKEGLNISPATFRKQLELMLKAGWYPVNFRDLFVPGGLQQVPAGKTPVVLTFDDARGTQFRYLKDGRIDPNCAVGILEAFHQKHGDAWPQRATFFVLPASKYTDAPFGQVGSVQKKFRFLLDNGYEIGNHSTNHRNMRHMPAERVAQEVIACRDYVRKIAPDATIDTFCLPYGEAPADPARLDLILNPDGKPQGQNLGICIAWGDESYSVYDKRFDRRKVTRFGVHPGRFEKAIARLGPGGRDHRKLYISDGDPTVVTAPKEFAAFARPESLAGARLVVRNPAPAKAPAAAAAAPAASPARKKPTATRTSRR
mgnify:CR=1 FL=1